MKRNHRKVKERIIRMKRQWAAQDLPCHLCGLPIAYDAEPHDPWSCQADHRNPIANGGHALGELLPSHAHCNQSRQAKDIDDYKATRTIRKGEDGKPTDIPEVKRPMKW